ncbi:MAG TPA: BtpA/SgcQ family protein [Gemmatimonadaceae bacterium]|nr:BtpA/SgcQ family protein [Gemmatimonadaceae bacterium]
MESPLPARAIIGMVHVQALPGAPRARFTVDEIVEQAATEARLLADAGFDAIIVENMHDRPYVHGTHGQQGGARCRARRRCTVHPL